MNFFLCLSGYEKDFHILPKLEELNVGIELQSYGLKGVASPQAWEEKIKQHKRVIENFSGRISVHGPFVGIRYTYNDYLLKEAVKKRMQKTYEMAKKLKPEILVVHSGISEDIKKWELEKLWLEETINFWKSEIKKYEKEGIKIVIENLVEESPDILIKLCDAVNSDFFALCLDIGHMNVFSNLSPSDWVKKMYNRLQYVHLHDNKGKKDEHLPVGKGNIDFDNFFNSIKNKNDITIALELDHSTPEEKVENLIEVITKYSN
ncbi:sugar phosphate isomerase/epimerase [candidate division WOR-3 bacterium]|nr:sugar phosphate isomerase/epimerase [candidate division WOR-3 bacterium]